MVRKAFFVLCFCLLLCGCTERESSAPVVVSTVPSQPEPSLPQREVARPELPVNGMPRVTNGFLNLDLLALAGSSNEALKAYYDGSCYVYVTGMGAVALEYYSPYIRILFEPVEGPLPTESGSIEEGGLYGQNPFADGLIIRDIYVQGEFDGGTQRVTGQDSLRLLFSTSGDITYTLLNEYFEQAPDMEHNLNAGVYPIAECGYDPHQKWIQVEGGIYSATYEAQNTSITVEFVKQEEDFAAIAAFFR